MNITIPSLKPEERIEDWQPLFTAATSSLAAHAGEKAVVQIMPSYVCRNEFERDTASLALKEETIVAAFKIFRNTLDPPIDEFEATSRVCSMIWGRGTRVEVFFTLLWREAKRAGFLNRQVCVILTTQLPNKVQSGLKKWIREREDNPVTDVQMREFIAVVQQSLRESYISLDYGKRERDERVTDYCKMIEQDSPGDPYSSGSDYEQRHSEVYEIRQTSRNAHWVPNRGGATRRYDNRACFTCGRKGHGYINCPQRVCGKCHVKGHDTADCRSGVWVSTLGNKAKSRDYVKKIGAFDEKSVSIVVKIRGRQVCALLDTGAKVNVMDTQTMDDMGLRKYLEPEANHIYGVSGTPISVIGSIELPIKVPGEGTRWTRVHVLVGEEQSLLLGGNFSNYSVKWSLIGMIEASHWVELGSR